MMKLFFAPGACSLAPHIVLEERGEPYETFRMDLAKNDQRSAEYLALNPRGRVPALATPDGVLSEASAILTYLAEVTPAPRLLPTEPFERARAYSLMSWLTSHVHIAFATMFRPGRFTGEEAAFQGLKAHGKEVVSAAMAELDTMLAGREWAFDQYSVVDPYILVFRRWASRIGLDMTLYPNLVAHGGRMGDRPAVQRVLADEGIKIDG